MPSLQWLALTSIVATVLGVQGERVEIDKGLIDGLRPGDRCQVFYTLAVDARRVRIEAGSAEIVDVDDHHAMARPLDGASIRPGYSIELRANAERFSSEAYLRLAKRRLEEGDLRSAQAYVDKVLAVEPANTEAFSLGRRILLLERTSGMNRVESGDYEIGANLGQASYYNQQPRFKTHLNQYWIDQKPVGVNDLVRVVVAGPPGNSGPAATGVTFMDAAEYCRSRSKRLPTEFEWEVAASEDGFERAAGISEWTASWYQPYPGNKSPEKEYGEKFRVVKGYRRDGDFDPLLRFFMAPPERAPDVGFRCAWDSGMD